MKRQFVLAWILVGTLCAGCGGKPAQRGGKPKQPGAPEAGKTPSASDAGAAGKAAKTAPEVPELKANRLERILPEDTIALITLDDIGLARAELPKTALGAIWREEDVQAFVAKPLAQINRIMRQVEAFGGFTFTDIAKAFGGQVAAALVRLDPPARRRGDPIVFAALAAHVTDAAAAGRLFDRAMELVKTGPMAPAARAVSTAGWRGFTLPVAPTAAVTLALGADHLLLAVAPPGGGDVERLMAACAKPPGESLATSEEFLHVTRRLGAARLATVYVSGDRLRDSIFAVARADSPKDSALAEKVVATLGLDRLHGIGASAAVDAPGFMQRVYYHAPSPRAGVMALVSDAGVSRETLALAPEGVLAFSAVSVKLSAIHDLVRRVAEVVGAGRDLEGALAMASSQFGFDIEKDLLANLGNDIALVVFPAEVGGANPLMMGFGGVSLVLSLKDATAAADVVDRLLMMADAMLQQTGSGSIEEIEYLGTKIRYARIMGGMIAPTVAVAGNRLFITGGLPAAKELVRLSRKNPEPFMESDDARAAFAKIGGPTGVSVSYADPEPAVLMGTAYTGIIAGMTLPALATARERARRTKCISNMKQITYDCHLWAGDHDERFPPSLDALFPDYITDRELFSCPSHPARRSYKYVAGLTAADAPDRILVYEPAGNHGGRGANASHVGGHVMWTVDVAGLEEKVAMQAARTRAAGGVVKVVDADTSAGAMSVVAGGVPGGGIDWGEFTDWVDLALLPSPRSYTRHLFPQVSRTVIDDDGILGTSYGPVGGAGVPSMGGAGGAAVIAAIAIPNLLSSRKTSNESAAIAGLRAYLGAQGTFQRVDRYNKGRLVYANPKDGTGFQDLYQIGGLGSANAPMKLIDLSMARATGPATPKAGYYFVNLTGSDFDGDYDYAVDCGLCAVPAQYGKSGLNTFVIDLTGTVYKKDTGGRPLTRYPDTTDAAWVPVGM